MSLLSGLIIQGARSGLSQGVSKAMGQAIGKALSTGAYGSGYGGGGGGAATQQAVQNYLGAQQPPPVEGVTVEGAAPAPVPAIGGAVGSALAPNTVAGVDVQGAPAGSGDVQALAAPAGAELLNMPPTDVEGFDVTAPAKTPLPSEAGVAPLASGVLDLNRIPGGLNLQQPQDEVKEGGPLSTVETVAMLSPLAALGLQGPGPTGNITPFQDPKTGGLLPGGITARDLIAGGLLAGGLAAGSGGTGKAGDALKDIAQGNKALADRLGSVADAGFQGNIGGKGLNTIARMVKKAQAAIRQRYAAMGMSGSTAEGDDLQAAVESGVELQFKIGQQMAQTGLNAIAALTGQSAQAYLALLNAQTQKDTALGNALANFAAAVAR